MGLRPGVIVLIFFIVLIMILCLFIAVFGAGELAEQKNGYSKYAVPLSPFKNYPIINANGSPIIGCYYGSVSGDYFTAICLNEKKIPTVSVNDLSTCPGSPNWNLSNGVLSCGSTTGSGYKNKASMSVSAGQLTPSSELYQVLNPIMGLDQLTAAGCTNYGIAGGLFSAACGKSPNSLRSIPLDLSQCALGPITYNAEQSTLNCAPGYNAG